jgi:hypothetical protein
MYCAHSQKGSRDGTLNLSWRGCQGPDVTPCPCTCPHSFEPRFSHFNHNVHSQPLVGQIGFRIERFTAFFHTKRDLKDYVGRTNSCDLLTIYGLFCSRPFPHIVPRFSHDHSSWYAPEGSTAPFYLRWNTPGSSHTCLKFSTKLYEALNIFYNPTSACGRASNII